MIIEIPYQTLDDATLQNLLEEIVTREGTDYGLCELSKEEKMAQVLGKLRQGHVKIIFNESNETCSICSSDDWNNL